MKKLIEQIFRFGIVGVLAFIIDYGLMVFCTEVLGIYYLWSSLISFTVSVIFNYVMSVKWVFNVDNGKTQTQNLIFFVTFSIIGLGINQLIMWLGVDKIQISYLIVKLFATAVVMVFNYVTRKWYFEK
ncbi:GtrA family protein [Dubosiella muris]|uniref:GtrA family protein n=2 Tax=Dubosiella TaxID=1937008 RepID=A0AC61R9C0_9FIRM|nr:GtrA family protein [Dubosiella muris]TGY66865.1 GtrA family protein [Dubosiella muris]